MNNLRLLATFTCTALLTAGVVNAESLERMRLDRLAATHAAIERLAAERRPVELASDYRDYRAILHAHSAFSHDSRGQIDEIVAGAKAAGVDVIMFSEHPASHYDYFNDGHHGVNDGVLLIPGAETGGFLAYPAKSIQRETTDSPQKFADLVKRDDGMIFLCHLEERMDWQIAGLTGSEIYNTHADVKDETRFLAAVSSPLGLLSLLPGLQKYPQETFGALLDYPADYLRRYDELCQIAPHTGVAGADSHHNQGMRATLREDGKVLVEDGLREKVAELDPAENPLLLGLVAGKKPGDVLLEVDLDPYERSFRHVSTHLLLPELSEAEVRNALRAGRAYVSFDWLGDPSGFVFHAQRGDERFPLGSQIVDPAGLRLEAAAPLPGAVKLIRNGQVIHEEQGRSLAFDLTQPGVYRIEVWLNVAGEQRPWILSNPIYVRPRG